MFSTILSPAFRAGTVFTGLAVVVTVLAMMVWLAICFTSTISLFKFSGILQLVAGMFMVIVILSYPAGWDNSSVVTFSKALVKLMAKMCVNGSTSRKYPLEKQ